MQSKIRRFIDVRHFQTFQTIACVTSRKIWMMRKHGATLLDSDPNFVTRMMKRRPGANANEPFSDSDADSDKYAKSSKGSRKFLKFLSPMQWLSVVVILVALVGLWKYLETTSRHLESIRTAEKTANIQRIASESFSIAIILPCSHAMLGLEKELAQTRDLMEKLNALEDEDDKNDSKKRPSKASKAHRYLAV